jgi:hypothetical protein
LRLKSFLSLMCLRLRLRLSQEVSWWSFDYTSKIKYKSSFSLCPFYDFIIPLVSVHYFPNNVTCQLNKNPIFWWTMNCSCIIFKRVLKEMVFLCSSFSFVCSWKDI